MIQIHVQAGSRPGAWCWTPTELIEQGVVMAALEEDRQTRPRQGQPKAGSANRRVTTPTTRWAPQCTHRREPQRGTNPAEASAPAAAMAACSSSTWASCSSWTSLSC
jgi:hypothetical protein